MNNSEQSYFVRKFLKWQDTRSPWIFIIVLTMSLVIIAHFLFQRYLYMEPCEQCVYIRFDMFIVSFGALIALVNPKNNILKILAYTFSFYGIWLGIEHCLTLNRIYAMIRSENPFGAIASCREIPIYPFNLPLYKWFPSWFLPTGVCGIDAPIVPEIAYENLNFFQIFFTGTAPDFKDGLYSDGWYLIPGLKFINMATACLLVFLCCFIILFLMLTSYILDKNKRKSKIYALLIAVLTIMLKVSSEPEVYGYLY